jgi:hypothetical protein
MVLRVQRVNSGAVAMGGSYRLPRVGIVGLLRALLSLLHDLVDLLFHALLRFLALLHLPFLDGGTGGHCGRGFDTASGERDNGKSNNESFHGCAASRKKISHADTACACIRATRRASLSP